MVYNIKVIVVDNLDTEFRRNAFFQGSKMS